MVSDSGRSVDVASEKAGDTALRLRFFPGQTRLRRRSGVTGRLLLRWGRSGDEQWG